MILHARAKACASWNLLSDLRRCLHSRRTWPNFQLFVVLTIVLPIVHFAIGSFTNNFFSFKQTCSVPSSDLCKGDHTGFPKTCPVKPVSSNPKILYVLPGFGGSLARLGVIQHNLDLLRSMKINLSCLLYVYTGEGYEASRGELATICKVLGPTMGAWADFVTQVPVELVQQTELVLVGADDVKMTPSVDMVQLAKIMHLNCVEVASPACIGSGHPIMLPYHEGHADGVVGRRTEAFELEFAAFTPTQFECFKSLLTTLFVFDPLTHSSSAFDHYFRYWCNASIAIIDTMIVEHDATLTGRLLEDSKKLIIDQMRDNKSYAAGGVDEFMRRHKVPKIGHQGGFQRHCGILRNVTYFDHS